MQLRPRRTQHEQRHALAPSRPGARGTRAAPGRPSADPRTPAPPARPPPAASRKRRQAVNDSSCAAGSPARPTSGASRARSQGRSWTSSGTARSSFAARLAPGESDSRIPASAFTISPNAQNAIPSPYGQTAPLPPAHQPRPVLDVAEQLRAQPALAHPRLADHRHQLARPLLRRPLERPDQQRLLQLPAHRAASYASGSRPSRNGPAPAAAARARAAPPCPSPPPAPAARSRTPAPSADTSAPRPRPRPPAPPPATARPCSRHHPSRTPRPRSGRAPSATTASPVLIPTRTCSDSAGSASFSSSIASRIRKPRPHRPLRIVLMRHRRPEHRHHRIPDELLHRPPVAARSPAAPARDTAGSAPAHPPGSAAPTQP